MFIQNRQDRLGVGVGLVHISFLGGWMQGRSKFERESNEWRSQIGGVRDPARLEDKDQ